MIKEIMKEFAYTHSFVKALYATGYKHSDLSIDGLAVLSGFAFRTVVHKDLCPSAMSVFDWDLLEKGARNCGFDVTLVKRLWHEEDEEVKRRTQAYQLISESFKKGNPVLAWDVSVPEWEVLVSEDQKNYKGISVSGKEVVLDKTQLGRREVPILFTLAVNSWSEVSHETCRLSILDQIISHHEGLEECTPDYKEGYKAYDLWIDALDQADDFSIKYYSETYHALKKHAAIYLMAHDLKLGPIPHLCLQESRLYEKLISTSHKAEMKNILSDISIVEKRIYEEAKALRG